MVYFEYPVDSKLIKAEGEILENASLSF